MKKGIKRILSVLLALSLLLGSSVFTNVNAASAFSGSSLVGQGIATPNGLNRAVPTPEREMVYEAAAIGLAHYNSVLTETTFKYDPNVVYSELLQDDSFQLDFTDYVLSYDPSNLQNLYDLLVGAEYSSAEAEFFADCWAVAFARMDMMDIWWAVFTTGDGMEAAFAPLPGQEPLEDVESMMAIVFDYYYESIFTGYFTLISGALAQDEFGMDYMEAMKLHYGTQLWDDFEGTVDAYWSLTSYSYKWVVASYLKNLAAMNGIFDEIGLVRESLSIGIFEIALSILGASFRFDPSKPYYQFWPVIADDGLLALIFDREIGSAASLRAELMNEGYTLLEADSFIERMAEVFAYQSLPSMKETFASENAQAELASLLSTPALAGDIEDLVEVMLAYYFGIMDDIANNAETAVDGEMLLQLFPWILAGYMQNFAVMNDITILLGTIEPDIYAIKNYELKEQLARTGITIAFAQAQEIDIELVDVDEQTMQALLDAILAPDLADIGNMLQRMLLCKGVSQNDLTIVTLLSLLLNEDLASLDVFEMADAVRFIASFSFDELFAELDKLEDFSEEELGDETTGAISGRAIVNLLRYFVEGWAAISQDVDALFVEGDNTLNYVLAWVTVLYVQNLAALNAEESSSEKASGAVSKQERLDNNASRKQLVTEEKMETLIDSFSLENSEIYDILDVNSALDSYYRGEFDAEEYLNENALLREAVIAPISVAASELYARITDESSEEFSFARSVMNMASTVMRSSGCADDCNNGCSVGNGCDGGGDCAVGCPAGCGPTGDPNILTFKEGQGGHVVRVDSTVALEFSFDFNFAKSVGETHGTDGVSDARGTDEMPSSRANEVTVEWKAETISGTPPVLVLTSWSNNEATFEARNIGIAQIIATATNGTDTITRSLTVRVTERDIIEDMLTPETPNNPNEPFRSSTEYNHPLATLSMYFSFAAYNPVPPGFLPQLIPGSFMEGFADDIRYVLRDYGFKNWNNRKHYLDDVWLNFNANKVGHTIAHKEVGVNGTTKTLIAVVIRGSAPTIDWLTNVLTASEAFGMKWGFHAASDEVRRNLEDYINTYKLADKNPIIWITGHSLGGAVANILADHLTGCDRNKPFSFKPHCPARGIENVYAYTFASPTVAYKSGPGIIRDVANPRKNIFNILNSCDDSAHAGKKMVTLCCDLVTQIPGRIMQFLINDDPWARHGQDAYIPMTPPLDSSLSLIELVSVLAGTHPTLTFDQLLGIIGPNHAMPTYLNWMQGQPDTLAWHEIPGAVILP